MSTYLITGVSRGLGFEFLRRLSDDPTNTVVGLVRDKATTEKKVLEDLQNRMNIHLVEGNLTDYASLKSAMNVTEEITGGSLDYVIANAALQSSWSAYSSLGVLGNQPGRLEQEMQDMFASNVTGNIHLFNLTIPLILKGRAKKIIAISSGLADLEISAKFDIFNNAPYSISKTALNMVVAKFSAQYASEGVLFMGISPGFVDTGHNDKATDEEKQALSVMFGKFLKYAPHFTGPSTADVAIDQMISVMERSSVRSGDGGSSVSQFGNKRWL